MASSPRSVTSGSSFCDTDPDSSFLGIFREASLDISESLYTRDVSELVARAKASLKIPKKLESGSVSQQEEPEVTDLGEEAMKDHGVKKGTLVCGWHIRGSRDKREHFTIEPSDGSKRIHVYKDGSSTQGIPKEC